jgi:hypothetical protein
MNLEGLAFLTLKKNVPGLQRTGFMEASKNIIKRKMNDHESCEDFWKHIHKFVPDGYTVDDANDVICIYEIEDTHPLTKRKITDMAFFWFMFDCSEVEVRLFVVDRYGMNIRELSLKDYYYHVCLEGDDK